MELLQMIPVIPVDAMVQRMVLYKMQISEDTVAVVLSSTRTNQVDVAEKRPDFTAFTGAVVISNTKMAFVDIHVKVRSTLNRFPLTSVEAI